MMTGYLLLTVAILFQIGYAFCRIKGMENCRNYKRIAYAAAFVSLNILILAKVMEWNFTIYILYFYLALRSVIGLVKIKLGKTKGKEAGKIKVILSGIWACIFSLFLVFPMILFPAYDDIAVTGGYQIETSSYTYIDSSRKESYGEDRTNRKVSVQFWYPVQEEAAETYPLVIFSHGSFGYRMSNYSTFIELASNGYVVCSIDHPYHAFYTDHTDGTSVIADFGFLNDVMQISAYDEEKIHELSSEWLEVRTGDMQFVLDTIIEKVEKTKSAEGKDKDDSTVNKDEVGNNTADNTDSMDNLFSSIDIERIGLSGHSLGGAAAAQVGRDRDDISGVICIDGTMLGEAVDFVNGEYVLNDTPYPVPLMNLYAQEHYEEAKELSETYQNSAASRNALESYDIMFNGAGHLNFTDLPMVSPILAGMLGTGSVDSRYCIETMNEIVLEFFDYTLKGENAPQFQEIY